MSPLVTILLLATVVAAGVYGMAVVATLWHTSSSPPPLPPGGAPPVSLLKPLKGLEEELRENLQSVYRQDYPGALEVVFAVRDRADPALAVARAVAAAHPEVPTRFVVSDPGFGLNPKVANLEAALSAARHDLVLQTDANVRLRPDYLCRVVGELEGTGAHLLSSLVVGRGERTVAAALNNVHLSSYIGPATCFAIVYAGVVCVIGKSMLFRRSDLTAVGGLRLVSDVLAEDFILGRAFQRAGKRVVLSSTAVENITIRSSVGAFVERQARWLKMRAVIHVPAFLIDPLANPVGLGAVAWLASGLAPELAAPFLSLVVAKTASDLVLLRRTRGEPLHVRFLWVPLLRDLWLLALWPWCAVSRSIDWRGQRRRLGPDSRLEPVAAASEVGERRRRLAWF